MSMSMVRKQRVIFILVVFSFFLAPSFFYLAQGQRPAGTDSAPSAEFIINILEKEKEKALQSGNKVAAEAIDTQLKDFKAGKITLEQLMKQRPKESGQSTSPQAGGYGGSGRPDAITGATPPEALLQYLERDREKALQAGDKKLAEGIDIMIADVKAGKITASHFKQENIPGILKPDSQEIIKRMEMDKEKALQSGDKALADIIDAQLKGLKEGKISVEQITGSSSSAKRELAPDMMIQILKKMKEEFLNSGDIKNVDEIDMIIESFESGDIEFEKLYATYVILEERRESNPGESKTNSSN